MSIFDKARAKAEELFGRAEQVYGESHGDAAATVAGEAHVLEAEAEEDALEGTEHGTQHGTGHDSGRHPDDDGLAGAR
jgi:uncharacterized protein YjbJ (UPF0337 family)